jgi:hypothetical protein
MPRSASFTVNARHVPLVSLRHEWPVAAKSPFVDWREMIKMLPPWNTGVAVSITAWGTNEKSKRANISNSGKMRFLYIHTRFLNSEFYSVYQKITCHTNVCRPLSCITIYNICVKRSRLCYSASHKLPDNIIRVSPSNHHSTIASHLSTPSPPTPTASCAVALTRQHIISSFFFKI